MGRLESWSGFEEGDSALFRFDPTALQLSVQLKRRDVDDDSEHTFTYSMGTGAVPPQGYRVLVNMLCFNTCEVEVLGAEEAEWDAAAEAASKYALRQLHSASKRQSVMVTATSGGGGPAAERK